MKQVICRTRDFLRAIIVPNNAESFGQRFASNALWSLGSSVISRSMGLAASIVVARMLGVAEFGELGLIRSMVLTIGILTSYGLGLTITKHIAELQHTDPNQAGRIISLTIATTLVGSLLAVGALWLFAEWIISYLNLEVSSTREVYLAGILLVANIIWSILQAALIGFQAFRELTLNNAIYGIVVLVLSVVLTFTMGITGSVLALSISALVGAFLAGRTIRILCRDRSIPLGVHFLTSDFSVLWHFSLPAYLSGIFVAPVALWALALVSASTNGTTEIGYFSLADQWRMLVLFIPMAIGSFILPMLTEAANDDASARYNRTLTTSLVLNLITAAFFAFGVIIFRDQVYSLYGNDFSGVEKALIIMMIVAIFQAGSSVIGNAIASLGKMWWGAILNALWMIVFIVGLVTIFPQSAEGLAYSYALAYAVLFVSSSLYLGVNQRCYRKHNGS